MKEEKIKCENFSKTSPNAVFELPSDQLMRYCFLGRDLCVIRIWGTNWDRLVNLMVVSLSLAVVVWVALCARIPYYMRFGESRMSIRFTRNAWRAISFRVCWSRVYAFRNLFDQLMKNFFNVGKLVEGGDWCDTLRLWRQAGGRRGEVFGNVRALRSRGSDEGNDFSQYWILISRGEGVVWRVAGKWDWNWTQSL